MAEPLRIFDPQRNFQLQGFTGRGATTTLHDASATGVSISGIFQAAEDFAVLGLYNAYDYFNHLRVKHLPRTDLSGLTLEFDIDYDHALDGAMRLDTAKYPSVSWDAMTFVCGKGAIHEVKLLNYAAVVSGGETPASVVIEAEGVQPYYGWDNLVVIFRDTQYTAIAGAAWHELPTDLPAPNGSIDLYPSDLGAAGDMDLNVGDWVWFTFDPIYPADGDITILEETCQVTAVDLSSTVHVTFNNTMPHAGGYNHHVRLRQTARHVLQNLADAINNDPNASGARRDGPDQSGVITATCIPTSETGARLVISFKTSPPPAPVMGKLGNGEGVTIRSWHESVAPEYQANYDPPYDPEQDHQGISWGANRSVRLTGGDNDSKYHISLPLGALTDKNSNLVPTNDCRKIYMVFAPRFEIVEEGLEDGCFLTAPVNPGDTTWQVDDASKLTGSRYFIGDDQNEERVLLVAGGATAIQVQRGFESSTPASWPAGTRMKKLPTVSGFQSDVEWGATISNLAVTGDASLKVGGDSERIEESDGRCRYTGFWEDYKYGAAGWPSQWWSKGHAKRTAPSNGGDLRQVTIKYSATQQHDLYVGTFLSTDCGKISVTVDGLPTAESPLDLYLDEYGGTTANVKVASDVAAGNHVVVIAALFEKSDASAGYDVYFDYLWPLVPQDVPDPPKEYTDVSLAIDFDTDHGYKKPPAWHLWHLQRCGFKGHADVYMGVFWNNKRRRVGASYPYTTIDFALAEGHDKPLANAIVSITVSGVVMSHTVLEGETLQEIVSGLRVLINQFSGVWADDNYGSSTTLRIQSKAPSWTFAGTVVNEPISIVMTLTDHLDAAGTEGDWELIDSVSPVMTEGARKWIRDLAGQFAAAGIQASFAFSMEVYNPPAAMRAKYLSLAGGVVAPGQDVYLEVPSYQMHFGTRVRNYLRQMYKECADEIAAAGLPVVLQFGETQWWYFDNRALDPLGGMPFYDQDTIDAFAAAAGHQIWPFTANTDDPAGNPAHPNETADFLRDRIWSYCQDVIAYVRQYHPAALFECLWPLDANQGTPSPSPDYRQLLMHVNLPREWQNSSYGIKYFRCEGFDYDIWQKNANLMRQTVTFAAKTLGRPAEECMYLAGLYGPPDTPMAQAYGMWIQANLYSMCFWAFDQFCLNSRPIPLEVWQQSSATAAVYHKPRAARALEAATAVNVVAPTGGAFNRFKGNEGKLNG